MGKLGLAGAGLYGLSSAMNKNNPYSGAQPQQTYTGGNLSKFRYDPASYNPDVVMPPNPPYRPVYAAEGGLMDGGQVKRSVDPMTGAVVEEYAAGGIAALGGYSDGGRLLMGPGDGMSDNIPARIGKKQPARLADGEFVVPADVVSHIGNGSTNAGAKRLYSMMDKVRQNRTGKAKQAPKINPNKFMPA
jgi:hypothetical protein